MQDLHNYTIILPDIPFDLIYQIISWVDDSDTYKACALVSTAWHKAARDALFAIHKFINTLTDLLKRPKYDMDWWGISRHPLITLDYVKIHHTMPWKWAALSENPNITLQMIKANPQYRWDMHNFSKNPNVRFEDVLEDISLWDWEELSCNNVINIDHVLDGKRLPWNWYWLSHNQSISIEDMLAHPGLPWIWRAASHKVTSIKTVNEHPELLLSWPALSRHLHLNADIVREYLDYWDWDNLCNNNTITIDIAGEFSQYFEHTNGLSIGKYIKFCHILANPGINWDWYRISRDPSITFDMVQANLGLPWDWDRLSQNSAITIDIIKANPDMPWNYVDLSCNPNMTSQYVLDHPNESWNFCELSWNTFGVL